MIKIRSQQPLESPMEQDLTLENCSQTSLALGQEQPRTQEQNFLEFSEQNFGTEFWNFLECDQNKTEFEPNFWVHSIKKYGHPIHKSSPCLVAHTQRFSCGRLEKHTVHSATVGAAPMIIILGQLFGLRYRADPLNSSIRQLYLLVNSMQSLRQKI